MEIQASGRVPLKDSYTEIFLYYLILIASLFIINLFIKKGEEVLWINGKNTPSLDTFFSLITLLGHGILFLPIILYTCFQSYRLSIAGVCMCIAHGLICLILKRGLFHNFKRPAALLNHDLLHFVEGVPINFSHSFPSGHTATIFCLAVFVSLVLKNRMVSLLMMIIALLVAYSRIYLVQHFLEDVIAGAIIGSATSFFLYQQFTSRKFPPWMNSRLRLNWRQRKSIIQPTGMR